MIEENGPEKFVLVACVVNGKKVTCGVEARMLLVDMLRDELGLTGTHIGCEQGVCGACTILIDGRPARSCTTLAAQIEGSEITTIEGITPKDGLSPMQQAFKECHGLQCGFCTPGFLMTLSGVDLRDYQTPERIRELLSGNICRCTGYQGIVAAVQKAWMGDETDQKSRS